MADLSVQELMDRMPRAFMPEKAEGVNATVQYHLTGEEGGDYIVRIADGVCDVTPGVSESPNLTLTADAQEYKDVITGKTNPMNAFMQGKVKLAGDLALAMKLINFFKLS